MSDNADGTLVISMQDVLVNISDLKLIHKYNIREIQLNIAFHLKNLFYKNETYRFWNQMCEK